MTDQNIKEKHHLRGILVAIAAIFVIQAILVLALRNDLAAFGLLLLLAATPLGVCLFIKGKQK